MRRNGSVTQLLLESQHVFAAGRLADSVDADVVRVRTARRAVSHFVLEQVIGAGLLDAAVQTTSVLEGNCTKSKRQQQQQQQQRMRFDIKEDG